MKWKSTCDKVSFMGVRTVVVFTLLRAMGLSRLRKNPSGLSFLRSPISEESLIAVKMCREGPYALLRMIRV
jgi:hypothetical protein